jgi:O-antigen ligase
VNITPLKNWLKIQDKFWLTSYILTIILPFGLIFNRSVTEACVAIIGALFLLNSFRNKKWEWLLDPVIKIAISAWVWLLFISLFAENIPASFSVGLPWIRYILLYAALRNWVLIRTDTIVFLGKILALMMIFVIIDTLWQYIFGISLTGHLRYDTGRLTGPLDNVKVGIFMAKMLFPIIGICLFFASKNKNKIAIISSILLLITAIVTILLAGERTAFASTMIALFSGSFILAICEKKLRKLLFAGISIIMLISIILFQTQDWVQVRAGKFYETIAEFPTTQYGQLVKGGFLVGKDNLKFGSGLKGFRGLCPNLLASEQVTTCNLHPHNLYIEWFAESGFIGVLLFTSLVCCLFIAAIKMMIKKKDIDRLLPTFAIMTLIVNFFPFMPTQSIFSNWPAILLFYSVSVAIAAMNVLNEKKNIIQIVQKI